MSEGTAEKLLAENAALYEWGNALKDLMSFYAASLVRVNELLEEQGLEISAGEAACKKQQVLHARVETAAFVVKAHRQVRQ